MFGNIVHFGHGQPIGNQPVPSPVSPQSSPSLSGLVSKPVEPSAPQVDSNVHSLEWLQQVIAQQTRLFEAAQHERALALTELKRIGQTICQKVWDAKLRSGDDPDNWSPRLIADLIIQSIQADLRSATLAHDPLLAEKYQQLTIELTRARAEIQPLRQRLQIAEQNARELKATLAQETQKRQGSGGKRAEATKPQPIAENPEGAVLKVDSNHQITAQSTMSNSVPTIGTGNKRVDDVIRLIATLGLCRWKDIRAALAQQWNGGPSAGIIDTVIKKAIGLELLRVEEVRLEWGGKPTGKMLILTEAGQQCARSLGLEPVVSQYTRGLAAHKDATHVYAILEVAGILSHFFADVNIFPVQVPLRHGKYYADLSVVTAMGDRLYIEVERATYKAEQDREQKWLRAAEANGGTIYVVTPNQESMQTILNEIANLRERHPHSVTQVRAFNVHSFRDGQTQDVKSPWMFEG